MKRFPPLLGVRVAAAERLSTTLRVVRSGDEERGGKGGRSVAVGSSLFLSSVGNSGCSRVGRASSFAGGKNKEVKDPSFEGACDTFFSSSLSLSCLPQNFIALDKVTTQQSNKATKKQCNKASMQQSHKVFIILVIIVLVVVFAFFIMVLLVFVVVVVR